MRKIYFPNMEEESSTVTPNERRLLKITLELLTSKIVSFLANLPFVLSVNEKILNSHQNHSILR